MNKCECPTDGRQERKIADSKDQSNKKVRPGQDLQSDAGERQQLDHEPGSSSSKGPMDIAIEKDDKEGDLGRQHEGAK
eukprot:8411314-Heterocapsa_arctica.AAC.1